MAEGGDGQERDAEDLSDEASPYKIEEMRRKGNVAQSRELTGLMALFAAAACCYAFAPQSGQTLVDFMKEVFRVDLVAKQDFGQATTLKEIFMKAGYVVSVIGLPICLAGFLLGVVSSLAQVGSIFTWEPLQPDLGKINPLSGAMRLLSRRHAVDSLRMVIKMVIVVAVSYGLVKAEVLEAPARMATEPGQMLMLYGQLAKTIFLVLFGVLAVFAGFDYLLQRREWGKQVRVTKAEAKQEHKEREGDPQIKARIRAVQREVARRRMMQAVKKATVVVTNPTHIAIALVYEKDMAAPKVVAKGADFMAQKIKAIAAEAGVPLVENVPLARTLYKTVKINQHIPRALYAAVAEVVAYVYKLRGAGKNQ